MRMQRSMEGVTHPGPREGRVGMGISTVRAMARTLSLWAVRFSRMASVAALATRSNVTSPGGVCQMQWSRWQRPTSVHKIWHSPTTMEDGVTCLSSTSTWLFLRSRKLLSIKLALCLCYTRGKSRLSSSFCGKNKASVCCMQGFLQRARLVPEHTCSSEIALLLVLAEWHVRRREACTSPSMATPTSSWCSSPMWAVQEMCTLSRARGRKPAGTQCKGTGVKSGSTAGMPWMVRRFPSWSQLATEELLSHKTLLLLVGSSAKLSKGLSFNKP